MIDRLDRLEEKIDDLLIIQPFKKYFNYTEAAKYTGLGVDQLKKDVKLIRKGRNKSRKKVIFHRDELDAYMEEQFTGYKP